MDCPAGKILVKQPSFADDVVDCICFSVVGFIVVLSAAKCDEERSKICLDVDLRMPEYGQGEPRQTVKRRQEMCKVLFCEIQLDRVLWEG